MAGEAWSDWMGQLLASARTLAKDGDPAAAAALIADLRAELELPADPELLIVEARMRLRSGRPALARPVLTELLDERPSHLPALRLRARVLASQGDLRGAIVDAVRVLEDAPDLDLVLSTLIRQQLIGDWDGASALLEAQRARLPELEDRCAEVEAELGPDASAAERLAMVVRPWHRRLPDDAALEQVEAALPLLRVDVEEEPDNARSRERLGAAELASGRAEDAVISYGRLVDIEPIEEEGWFGLARALLDAGRPQAAMAAADRALAINPDSHRARMVRVEAAPRLDGDPWRVTESDDRLRLLRETKDGPISSRLAPMLEASGDHRGAAAMRAMAGEPLQARPIDDPAGSVDGLVVYTVVTGGYEQPSDPRDALGLDADVVIFTDDPAQLPAAMQPIARRLSFDGPPQLASRHPKMLPHLYFPDHERSIYVDANFHLLTDPRPLAAGLSADRPMTVLRHSERSTPVAEARLVVERGFASWLEVRDHFDRQRAAGFDPAASVLSYGGFLARRHGTPELVSAMDAWWEQFEQGVRRDQLSLDFALWSAGVEPTRLPLHNHRNEHWVRIPHV